MRYVENQLQDWNDSPAPASPRNDGTTASNVRSSRCRSAGGRMPTMRQ
jgi:hypothetical protein